jgi:hypothetical protein
VTKLIERITAILPANRIAAIIGFLTAIGAALVTLQTSFIPGSPPAEAIAKAIAIVGALVTAGQIVLKFLEGSHKWDMLMHGVNPVTGVANAAAIDDGSGDTGYDGPVEDPPTEDMLAAQYDGEPPAELADAPRHEELPAAQAKTTRRRTGGK